MAWTLKAGAKNAKWLEKLHEEQGTRIKSLENKPELFDDLHWIWNAFHCCSTTRDWIDGIPQRVKLSEVEAYCRMHFIDEDDVPFLTRCVLMLDTKYTNDVIRDQQREAQKRAKKNQRRMPRRGR